MSTIELMGGGPADGRTMDVDLPLDNMPHLKVPCCDTCAPSSPHRFLYQRGARITEGQRRRTVYLYAGEVPQ